MSNYINDVEISLMSFNSYLLVVVPLFLSYLMSNYL